MRLALVPWARVELATTSWCGQGRSLPLAQLQLWQRSCSPGGKPCFFNQAQKLLPPLYGPGRRGPSPLM
jgi:hypothetical protein